jgi:hypothetical protein
MAITQKEQTAPTQLAPVRFHLDDIEQIVQIFEEAERANNSRYDEQKPKTTFTVGNQICDELTDLAKIGKSTIDFKIALRRPGFAAEAEMSAFSTRWYSYGQTPEEEWATYRKLEPLFQKKIRHTRAALDKWPTLGFITYGVAAVVGVAALVVPIAAIAHWLVPRFASPIASVLIFPAFLATMKIAHRFLGPDSVVIFRHSSEVGATREDRNNKLVIVAVSALIAFALGVVSMFLKHKYWP